MKKDLTNHIVFEHDGSRVFISTHLGCESGCTYCYLPHQTSFEFDEEIVPAQVLFNQVINDKRYKQGQNGTLVSLGCYSEPFSKNSFTETVELIDAFLQQGNRVQIATKQCVSEDSLQAISDIQQYANQFVLLTSCAAITDNEKIEIVKCPLIEFFSVGESIIRRQLLAVFIIDGSVQGDQKIIITVAGGRRREIISSFSVISSVLGLSCYNAFRILIIIYPKESFVNDV